MRAIYQLNGEKLHYNIQVLDAKKKENASLISILKKKERFFLNLLKRKNDDFALKYAEFGKTNFRLTEQAKNLTRQYRELHKKFQHFEHSDLERYQEIRNISISNITSLREKILMINQVIMNHQLGLTVGETSKATLATMKNSNSNNSQLESSRNESVKSFSRASEFQRNTSIRHSTMNEDHGKASIVFTNDDKLKLIELVLKETEFLLDDKIRSEIEALSSEEEKLLTKMNIIRKVFVISSQTDLNEVLLKLHLHCLDNECQNYNPSKVITTLSKLVEGLKMKSNHKDSRDSVFLQKNQEKEKAKNEELRFWKESSSVLQETDLAVWKEMESFTLKYYHLL